MKILRLSLKILRPMGNKEAETDFQKRLPIMSRRTQVGAAPQGVRFQRSGCRTANGQGVVFGRHIQQIMHRHFIVS